MSVLGRAALAGVAVGVGDVLATVAAGFVPGAVAMLLTLVLAPLLFAPPAAWAVRLPGWPLTAFLAVLVMYPAAIVTFTLVFTPPVKEFLAGRLAEWAWLGLLGLLVVVSTTFGFALAAWIRLPGTVLPRAVAGGAVVVALLAVWPVSEVIERQWRAWQLERSGLPLIAPDLPGYRLTYDPIGLMLGRLSLVYTQETGDDRSTIEVRVMPASVATPAAACAKPFEDLPVHGPSGRCRQVSAEVWARTDDDLTTVYARHGDALVHLDSFDVTEAELLAVLSRFRPVTAEELAAAAD